MTLTDEDLLAISGLMDKKLEPVKQKIHNIQLTLENDIRPRLSHMEACYLSTYDRYHVQAAGYE